MTSDYDRVSKTKHRFAIDKLEYFKSLYGDLTPKELDNLFLRNITPDKTPEKVALRLRLVKLRLDILIQKQTVLQKKINLAKEDIIFLEQYDKAINKKLLEE